MSPRDAADLEWPLSEGMQVSALPPVWIAMIISCWSVKLLKLPSVTLKHVCGTNSRNWWAKGLPGVGVVKIFYDSDSSGWKSFWLRLLDSDSTALVCILWKQFVSEAILSSGVVCFLQSAVTSVAATRLNKRLLFEICVFAARPVTRGGETSLENFSPSQKCVGYSLKILDIVQ